MIVRCPSCGTQYEHQADQIGVLARCSQCEDCVPIRPAKRNYVLMPGQPVQGQAGRNLPGGGIGMDDPRLAERLRSTGVDVSGEVPPGAVAYSIGAIGGTAEADALGGAEGLDAEQQPAQKPLDLLLEAQRAEMAKPDEGNPLREMLVTMLLTAAGAMGGYYLSLGQGFTPSLRMAAGGTLGLLFGWLCIRWMRPKR